MGRLQDIVTTRRRRMAGHVLRLQTEILAHAHMYWLPEDGRRKRGCQRRHGAAEYVPRRSEIDGCQLARGPPDRQ